LSGDIVFQVLMYMKESLENVTFLILDTGFVLMKRNKEVIQTNSFRAKG